MRLPPPLPAALVLCPRDGSGTSGWSQVEDRDCALLKARTVPLLSPQHAKKMLFRSVQQPLPFLFLLILGTKGPELLPTEVKSIQASVCTWGFLKRPLFVTHTSPSIPKSIQMPFHLGTALLFPGKRFCPLGLLSVALFSNFNFIFEQLHHTSPILGGGGETQTRKSTVIHITLFPRQRTKTLLAKYHYFYATKIQLDSQLHFIKFTPGTLLEQGRQRNSQGLSLNPPC